MSPRNLVVPLNHLCLKIISNRLIYALSDEEGKYHAAASKYLADATNKVLQDLLEIILDAVNLDASIRFSCLQLLLREDVRKLDSGMFPQFYYDKILNTITEQGKGLQQLNLKGVWVRDFPHMLSKVVESAKNLEVLVIPHMANDEVITSLGALHNLTVLNICGEACYSVSGIKKFQSATLRVLDIGSYGKIDLCPQEPSGCEVLAEIIINLPGLTSLRTYSYTGRALSLIHKQKPMYKTRLKYLHDTTTTMEIMEGIVNSCPDLESLHLDSPEPGVVERLSKFRRLHSLKLTKYSVKELLAFLRVSGTQLQVLKLNHNKNTSLDLSEICLHAPSLATLECFQMKVTFSNPDTYFMNLRNVELLYCDVSDGVSKLILTNSPFLTRIVIGGCIIAMTDGDIFRLCAECDFAHLEEIRISCAKSLTGTSVELLMGHCPKLRVLGQLSGWDVNQDRIDYLRGVIASTNIDLTLLPVDDLH